MMPISIEINFMFVDEIKYCRCS